MIVVDTNIIMALLVPVERSEDAEAALQVDAEWAAPLLWRSELRNALLKMLRVEAMTLAYALAVARKAALLVGRHEYAVPDDEVLALALDSGCSAYDCEFVAVARGLAAPLVTLDRKLAQAFPDTATLLSDYLT